MTYTKETSTSKKRRLKAATGEANEAIEMAEELGVKDNLFGGKKGETRKRGNGENGGDDDALKALIMGRQQERHQQGGDFLSILESRYGGGKKDAIQSKAKRRARRRRWMKMKTKMRYFQSSYNSNRLVLLQTNHYIHDKRTKRGSVSSCGGEISKEERRCGQG